MGTAKQAVGMKLKHSITLVPVKMLEVGWKLTSQVMAE